MVKREAWDSPLPHSPPLHITPLPTVGFGPGDRSHLDSPEAREAMFLRRAGRSEARESHISPSTLVLTTSPSPFHPQDIIVFLKHKPNHVLR